jgi:hypothetical protein
MPHRLEQHGPIPPCPRVSADPARTGYFHPREVADILGCPKIDYAQLRRLFKLARLQTGGPVADSDHRWSRYTLRDIAAVEVALRLSGGPESLDLGRRLRVAPVEAAVRSLLDRGIRDPLLEVPMERHGAVIVAAVAGDIIDPTTGQLVLRRVFAEASLHVSRGERRDVLKKLRQEREAKLVRMRNRVQAFTENLA